jgi:hypothetical protein
VRSRGAAGSGYCYRHIGRELNERTGNIIEEKGKSSRYHGRYGNLSSPSYSGPSEAAIQIHSINAARAFCGELVQMPFLNLCVYARERNSHEYSFIIHEKKLNSQRIVHSHKSIRSTKNDVELIVFL